MAAPKPKMTKYVIQDTRNIPPFNQPARELSVLNKPLWLAQRDALADYCATEYPVQSLEDVPAESQEIIVHRDNLFFDEPYIKAFVEEARARRRPCRAAFTRDDDAFVRYVLPLTRAVQRVPKRDATGKSIKDGRGKEEIDHYEIDLWYFPKGYRRGEYIQPVYVKSECEEKGYYSVPDYMSNQGNLTHLLTQRSMISVENWVHLFFANIIMGIFSIGHRFEVRKVESNLLKLRILWKALLEQTQVLSCSELVKIGKNCSIDPTAIIQGPTIIGDNCVIGPGVTIRNCYIGNNVTIDQGNDMMLSVINDYCFLPFRASLYLTVLMEHSIVAQNTCLQMCVIGRGSFIGAGTTFTDFNLLPTPIKVEAVDGTLERTSEVVLGGCVGHNCRLGSGLIIYPARVIESDVVLFASPSRRVIMKKISFEESDHHDTRPEVARLHKQKYPRPVEGMGEEAFLESW
jgi:carbonic anhydrase/acetyltransferase-like protein (isoleucine patch superfamily)